MYRLTPKYASSCLKTTSRILISQRFQGLLQIMPKSRKIVCTTSQSVTSVSIEVIGSGAPGAPASVVLNTNLGTYLFNCGEGTMKIANEHKIKIHRSTTTFITYPSWRNISGLTGLALMLQESHLYNFNIHGSLKIGKLFTAINKFVNLKSLKVSIKEGLHGEEFSDGTVTVKYIVLQSSSSKYDQNSSSSTSIYSDASDISLDKNQKFHLNKHKNNVEVTKENETCHPKFNANYSDSSICYVIKTPKTPGALILEKCIEFGVPPGPLLGQLKYGMDVTLENGNVVKSSDVTMPDLPGVSVIVLECPSEEFLDSLLEEPAFHEFQSTENAAAAIVHFSRADIVKNNKYQEWMSSFPKSTLHLFINEENKQTGSVAIHRLQLKLNHIHPELFPLLANSNIPEFPRGLDDIQSGHVIIPDENQKHHPFNNDRIMLKCESNNFIYGETLCQLALKPKTCDYSRSIIMKKEVYLSEMFVTPAIKAKILETINEIKDFEEKLKSDTRVYPKIVFLGTGSSKPSKVRNGSGILIFIDEFKCILLDCAEGTFGQLVSLYGPQRAREILRNLHAVYISHMHVDHHLGLITLIKERKLAFDHEMTEAASFGSNAKSLPKSDNVFNKVFVLSPVQISNWLKFFCDQFEDISDLYQVIPNSYLIDGNEHDDKHITLCKKLLNVDILKTVTVNHCIGAFGVSLGCEKAWKITYSGDTRPCAALIKLGRHCDVLIHEATFENSFFDEAKMKQHSTIEEAIEIGKKMNAKYTLLTHFSQRYCYLPNIESLLSNTNVGIAFDFLEVPFNKLPLLPKMIKPLQLILAKYDERNKVATELFLQRKGKNRLCKKQVKSSPEAEVPRKILKMNH